MRHEKTLQIMTGTKRSSGALSLHRLLGDGGPTFYLRRELFVWLIGDAAYVPLASLVANIIQYLRLKKVKCQL